MATASSSDDVSMALQVDARPRMPTPTPTPEQEDTELVTDIEDDVKAKVIEVELINMVKRYGAYLISTLPRYKLYPMVQGTSAKLDEWPASRAVYCLRSVGTSTGRKKNFDDKLISTVMMCKFFDNWLHEFVNAPHYGIQYLTGALSKLSPLLHKKKPSAPEGHARKVLTCLYHIAKNDYGGKKIIELSPDTVKKAITYLNDPDTQNGTKIPVIVLQSLVQLLRFPNSYAVVSDALKYYQNLVGERYRFETIVTKLLNSPDLAFKENALIFINRFLDGCDMPNERVMLQSELHEVGFNIRAIEAVRAGTECNTKSLVDRS
eukprot:scpid81133/ scgid15420/ 